MEKDNIIRINNIEENPECETSCYVVKYPKIEGGKDEIVTFEKVVSSEDINRLQDEMNDTRSYYMIEKVRFSHLKYVVEISIYLYRESGDFQISVDKIDISNNIRTILLEKMDCIESNQTFYIPGFADIMGCDMTLDYTTVGEVPLRFVDYSHSPIQYNKDGWISVNDGSKYPLSIYDTLSGNLDVLDYDLNTARSLYILTEGYGGMLESLGFLILVQYYKPTDALELHLLTDEGITAVSINDGELYLIDELGNPSDIDMDDTFSFEKISDNEYNITLDLDYIPDKMQIKDGFGNQYTIEKYRRLRIIK